MVYQPLVVLAIGMIAVVGMIQFLRINAFIALVTSALIVSFAAVPAELPWPEKCNVAAERVTNVAEAFGSSAGKIGIVIAMAAVIGKCLMESGAADRIVRGFLALFGEKRAWLALLASGYVLSIPVFFDTVFYLLVPLAITLCLRTGKDYLLAILAIAAGAAATHALVPPTPGPLVMADVFGESGIVVDLGLLIAVGMAVALVPALVGGWATARWLNRHMAVPLRAAAGTSLEALRDLARRPTEQLPSLGLSLLPVVLPVLLIGGDSAADFALRMTRQKGAAQAAGNRSATGPAATTAAGAAAARQECSTGHGQVEALCRMTRVVGNPNLALMLSAFVAMATLKHRRRVTLDELGSMLEPALAAGALIILITAGGGAFGKALADSGVGDSIAAVATRARVNGLSWLPLAFAVAAVLKIAQGSSTVAMITTAGMVGPILARLDAPLGYHPVYLLMAIGCGSITGSWMNDSGFWIVCRMSGFTEGETLKTFSVMLVLMGFSGLATVLLAARFVPLTGLT